MIKVTRRQLSALAAGGAVAGFSTRGHAEAWPSRPITMVVPFPAGGSADAISRALAQHLYTELGQPVVVDNRAGANGNVAATYVAKATPDGYTLFLTTNGPLSHNTFLYRNLAFNPERDFAPIGLVGQVPIILAAKKDTPYPGLKELVAFAGKNPGAVTFGSPGVGSIAHLTAILFQKRAGIKLTHIPYRGTAPMLNDLIGGVIDMAVDVATTYVSLIQSNTISGIGVTSLEPLPQLPDLPAFAKSGYPDLDADVIQAMVAQAAVAPEIVARLNASINSFLALKQTQDFLASINFRGLGGTPDDLRKELARQTKKWGEIIEADNIKLD